MHYLTEVSATILCAVHVASCLAADVSGPRQNKPLGITVKMMDGGLLGHDKVEETGTAEPSGAPPPKFYYMHYFWDGVHLRVRPGNDHLNEWSKEETAKNGWYVTADYSTDPPRVILTKDPTTHSKWRFAATPRRRHYYIENVNDQGKDAWLSLEDSGKTYSWGRPDAGYRTVRVYMAVLSTKPRDFFVNDIEEDGGK
jgi:hypothetical protein